MTAAGVRSMRTWREVDAEEWAAVVLSWADDGPTARLIKQRTKDAAEVRRQQAVDNRRLYLAPHEGPPELAFAVTPPSGPGVFRSACVRAVGNYGLLPDLLGEVELFRVLACSDALASMQHLNPEWLTMQYTLALTPQTIPDVPPSQRLIDLSSIVGPEIRTLWSEFWYDHEQRRAARGLRQPPASPDQEIEQLIAQDLEPAPDYRYEATYFTTHVDGRQVGIARCRRHPQDASVVSIEGNYVHPEFRGQGIGRDQLLMRLYFAYHTLGCTRALSGVAPGNEESQQNLIDRGFTEESAAYLIRR